MKTVRWKTRPLATEACEVCGLKRWNLYSVPLPDMGGQWRLCYRCATEWRTDPNTEEELTEVVPNSGGHPDRRGGQ